MGPVRGVRLENCLAFVRGSWKTVAAIVLLALLLFASNGGAAGEPRARDYGNPIPFGRAVIGIGKTGYLQKMGIYTPFMWGSGPGFGQLFSFLHS